MKNANKITNLSLMAIPYLSWNSGVPCKNSNPGWDANSSLKTGLKSSYMKNVKHKGHSYT